MERVYIRVDRSPIYFGRLTKVYDPRYFTTRISQMFSRTVLDSKHVRGRDDGQSEREREKEMQGGPDQLAIHVQPAETK